MSTVSVMARLRIVAWSLLLTAALWPGAAGADRSVLVLLKSSSIPPFEQAAAAIAEELAHDPLRPEVLVLDLGGDVANGPGALARAHQIDARLLVTVGSLATSVALGDPRPLPTVFSMVLYPEQSGFLQPDRPVTGASLDVPPDVAFGYLQRLLPRLHRVAVLYSPQETGMVVEEARGAAAARGLELVTKIVEDPAGALAALREVLHDADAVWAVADSHVFSPQTTASLILEALQHRVPVFGLSAGQVRAGALAALSCDNREIGRQAADLAGKVLRGQKPRSLPMTRPTRAALVLNLKIARYLDIAVPHELEAEAAEVVR